jgi:amino acid adenylation domain-containing protein
MRVLPEPLRNWSGTASAYPRNASVVTLFEEIVREHPGAVALTDAATEITYQELNTRANRLAARLRFAGVHTGTLVACCLQRSIEMIVGFLAVLKAGGAYLPLDPGYPQPRLDLILDDAGRPLILTSKSLASSLGPNSPREIIVVDHGSESFLDPANEENPQHVAGPASLAYVMYTSGSTGRPKGVMVEHRGIVRLVRDTNYCHFGPDETFLQFAPPSFDASTFEIWGALLNGSRLVLMPEGYLSLIDLVRTVRTHGVTTLWLTAGLFHLMAEEHAHELSSVRQILAGGDTLSPRQVRRFLEHAPATTLINGYGPTENTTFTCCHRMRAGDSIADSIPIGRPVSNTKVYILDEKMNAVAPGETGELYAAGDGVARGYLNDPEMTATRFLSDPFAEDAHERMYRTGDLARWGPDGSVEFLGRMDTQVKILGYRIEPTEIEVALEQHSRVRQVCVVAQGESGDKRLIAYFVPTEPAPSAEELRDFTASHLPHHMVPAFFVALDSLPLSENGKVDRKALANMELVREQQQAAPLTGGQLERTLVQVWERILRVQKVGLDDNFFDLGGDSLRLAAVHSSLQKQLQREISLTDLFEFSTIRKLAQHLGHTEQPAGSGADSKERALRQREAFTRFRSRRSGRES